MESASTGSFSEFYGILFWWGDWKSISKANTYMNSDWNVWKVWLAQKIFAIHVHGSWHPYEYHMNMMYGTCNLPSTQCELDLINTNLLYAVYSLLFLFILILDMKTWCKLFVNYIKYWVNFLKTPTQSNFIVYSDGFPLECFFFL